MTCKCTKQPKPQKAIGIVFNPWVEVQEYTFYGNVFAEKKSVKEPEPGKGLVVTNRCKVTND